MKKFIPLILLAACLTRSVPAAAEDGHIKVANKVKSCEVWLSAKISVLPGPVQKIITVAGFPTLVTPISWALREPNKAKFLYEIARSGVWINLAGAVMGRLAAHPKAIVTTLTHAYPSLLEPILTNPYSSLIQPYISYQLVNAARQGVALREGLSTKTKILSNWILTTYVYTMTDILPQLVGAAHVDPAKMGASFIYSATWATFSEVARQYATNPLFYHMFPKADMIKKMKESTSTDSFIKDIKSSLDKLRAEYEALKGQTDPKGRIKELKDEMLAARTNIFWIKYMRKKVKDGEKIPEATFKRLDKNKNRTQIGVGLSLLTLFFTAKFLLVGNSDEPGALYKFLSSLDWDELFDSGSALVDKITDVMANSDGYFDGDPVPMP